jgi:hypothetical protein
MSSLPLESEADIRVFDVIRSSGKNNHLLSFHSMFRISHDTDRTENIASNISSIVACVFLAAGTFLTNRYLAISGRGGADSKVIS